jgi:hypothetical protein
MPLCHFLRRPPERVSLLVLLYISPSVC